MLKRTILHLRSSRTLAGPERHLLELLPGLAARGVVTEVALLYRRRPGDGEVHPLLEELGVAGIPAFQIDDPDRVGREARKHLVGRLRRGDIRALHGHDPKSNWLIARVCRAGGRPAVADAGGAALRRLATLHLHTRETLALRLYRRLDLALVRRFDGVIAVSRGLLADVAKATDTRSYGRAPTPSLRVIANGIDGEKLRSRAAATPPFPRSDLASPVLVAAGRLARQKGFDLLLAALPRIIAAFPRLELWLAGEGPERAALALQVERLKLGGQVRLLGERRDLAALFAAADVFILPSRGEGSPYVLLEAMAMGLPVVATAVGDVPETLGDEAGAALVPPGNAAALGEAILGLLRSPGEARLRGQMARERIDRSRSASRMADETAAFYSQVLP
ncbi:MAG: glycosyltransferase family 4 protein [Thermoanaerobaculia bacterium]